MQLSSGAGCPKFDSDLNLHPYFVYPSSEGSGKTVLMQRLIRVFTAHVCFKYHNHMTRLLLFSFYYPLLVSYMAVGCNKGHVP